MEYETQLWDTLDTSSVVHFQYFEASVVNVIVYGNTSIAECSRGGVVSYFGKNSRLAPPPDDRRQSRN